MAIANDRERLRNFNFFTLLKNIYFLVLSGKYSGSSFLECTMYIKHFFNFKKRDIRCRKTYTE